MYRAYFEATGVTRENYLGIHCSAGMLKHVEILAFSVYCYMGLAGSPKNAPDYVLCSLVSIIRFLVLF
jgi:hypothetical protein